MANESDLAVAVDYRQYQRKRCFRMSLVGFWFALLIGLVILVPLAVACTECKFDAVIISTIAVGCAFIVLTTWICHRMWNVK